MNYPKPEDTRLKRAVWDVETEVRRVEHDLAKQGVSVEKRNEQTAEAFAAAGKLREFANTRDEVTSS